MNHIHNIVLVHGFWMDGSSYRPVISKLLAEGFEVLTVQNSLTSLAEDVAATKRALARLDGPCLLVGRSWGGMVITEAGHDDRVAGLVYLAALAPDAGESMIDLISPYGSPSPHFQEQDGVIWISKAGVAEILANDLPAEQVAILYATQMPPAASLPAAQTGSPAWKQKPSWYLVANHDRAVPPELQRHLAQRMGATTTEVKSSHAVMLSQADAVLDLIQTAAHSV